MSKSNELQKKWKIWNSQKPDEKETTIDLGGNWQIKIDFFKETFSLRYYHPSNLNYPHADITCPLSVLESMHKCLQDFYK
jgi:hypothetical protein